MPSRRQVEFVAACLRKAPEERATARELLQHPLIAQAGESDFCLEVFLHHVYQPRAASAVTPLATPAMVPPGAPQEDELQRTPDAEEVEEEVVVEEGEGEDDYEDEDGEHDERVRASPAVAFTAPPQAGGVRALAGRDSHQSGRGVGRRAGKLGGDDGDLPAADGMAEMEMQRFLEMNDLMKANDELRAANNQLSTRSQAMEAEVAALRQELEATRHESVRLSVECERSHDLIGELQRRLAGDRRATVYTSATDGGGRRPPPLTGLQTVGLSHIGPGHGVGAAGSPPLPPPPHTPASLADDEALLLPLDPRRLEQMHPADLERLQSVAESHVRDVRTAIRRRSRSRRKPAVPPATSTGHSSARASGRPFAGSRPPSAALGAAAPPSYQRPYSSATGRAR